MTEREKAAEYLRYIASMWPSEGFCERSRDRGLPLTPEIISLGKAIIRTCAEQIERGQHDLWAEERGL